MEFAKTNGSGVLYAVSVLKHGKGHEALVAVQECPSFRVICNVQCGGDESVKPLRRASLLGPFDHTFI